jgi:hypothetical protein
MEARNVALKFYELGFDRMNAASTPRVNWKHNLVVLDMTRCQRLYMSYDGGNARRIALAPSHFMQIIIQLSEGSHFPRTSCTAPS